MTRDEAWALLTQYNQGEFHLRHARTVEGVMRHFANELGYGDEADFWANVGLLHDIDFEQWPDEHCQKARELLENAGCDERLIHAVVCHGYGLCSDVKPEHEMEKVLFAVDELTGLISAAAIMRPSRSLDDLELPSVKKKFKDKKFAAGCSRDVIRQGAEMLGWTSTPHVPQNVASRRAATAGGAGKCRPHFIGFSACGGAPGGVPPCEEAVRIPLSYGLARF